MEGIFQLEKDKIIFVNQNGADFLKKELSTLFGSSFYDYLDGVHQLYFENILNRFQTKELEDYLAEFELIDSFGAKITTRLSSTRLRIKIKVSMYCVPSNLMKTLSKK